MWTADKENRPETKNKKKTFRLARDLNPRPLPTELTS